jgi:rhodanese-related sulfurtransferase
MSTTLRTSASDFGAYAGDVSPLEAYQNLKQNKGAVLIDVRTQPEWQFSGLPDLAGIGKTPIAISLKLYPDFSDNPNFLGDAMRAIPAKDTPIYCLCKTGGRSALAAAMLTGLGYSHAYNIAGGFEGDLNSQRRRGQVSGWKAAQLPWEQA